MLDKKMTAEEIYDLIVERTAGKDMGIKLIHNYGLRKQQEIINNLQKEAPGYSGEIEGIIEKMNAQLDEMINAIIGVRE